jgi:hypothetical protein
VIHIISNSGSIFNKSSITGVEIVISTVVILFQFQTYIIFEYITYGALELNVLLVDTAKTSCISQTSIYQSKSELGANSKVSEVEAEM